MTPEVRRAMKTGRPRVSDRLGWAGRFAIVLPQLQAEEISQAQAARELGISVRSLKRYIEKVEQSAQMHQGE